MTTGLGPDVRYGKTNQMSMSELKVFFSSLVKIQAKGSIPALGYSGLAGGFVHPQKLKVSVQNHYYPSNDFVHLENLDFTLKSWRIYRKAKIKLTRSQVWFCRSSCTLLCLQICHL